MAGDYRKYSVEMRCSEMKYRLWKRRRESAACIFETYREKRSVCFSVSNLLPSSVLLREENREYHLILMGSSGGALIHKDLGVFLVNPRGEGAMRRRFTGEPLSGYTHCLLAAVDQQTGLAETVLIGTMPFFNREQTGASSQSMKKKEDNGNPGKAFLKNISGICGQEAAHRKSEILDEPEKPFGFQPIWDSFIEKYDKGPFSEIFTRACDETGAAWCRISGTETLPAPLVPYGELIKKYGHYIIGKNGGRYFAGIPGRFLQSEQPGGECGLFSLWQPIRGGERFFESLSEITAVLQEEIYGYWICGIDELTGELREV